MMNKNKNLLVIFMLFSSYSHSDSFNLDALDNYHNIHDIENIILNLDHQPAGIYSVDLIVNNVRLLTSNIAFKYIEDQLTPIFNKEQLIKIGLNKQTLNQMEFNDNGELTDKLSKIIIGYSYYFDFNHLTLELNIPKHFLDKDEKELNSQDSWSDGITSAFIDYHLLGSHNSSKYIEDNFNLSLMNGFNYLGWRLRNHFNYSSPQREWEYYNTTLSYPIRNLKSQLTLGEYYLTSSFFIPFSFKGFSLSNDELMYPEYDAYYSPVLQGINHSPAQVTVKQNNIIIFNDYLPAGPFMLNKLKPLNPKGILDVIITESNGTIRQYQYPFSSSLVMIKQGQFRYAINSGSVSHQQSTSSPYFLHGEMKYGLNNHITVYGGSIFSQPFKSFLLGSSFSIGRFGNININWTQNQSVNNSSNNYQLEYTNLISSTGTNITFGIHWINNPKLRLMTDIFEKETATTPSHPQQGLKIHLSQSLGFLGNLLLSASQQRVMQNNTQQWSYNINYSGNLNEYHFNLNCQSNYSMTEHKPEYVFSASMIIPINAWLPNTYFSYQAQHSPNNYQNRQATLTGAILNDDLISYTLQHNQFTERCCSSSGNQSETRFYTQYHHNKFFLNAGYGYKQDHQFHYGLRSSIVAHPYGVTFTPSRGETAALLIVPDTKDVRLDTHLNVRTDSKGHAIINQLQPYRRNHFVIDTLTLPLDAEIETNFQSTLPTKGALVAVHFPVKRGKRVFFTIQLDDEKLAPFGAIASLVTKVSDSSHNDVNVGIINDVGQVYLSGLETRGTIKLKWGERQSQQCEFHYQLLASYQQQGFYHVPVVCQRKEAL